MSVIVCEVSTSGVSDVCTKPKPSLPSFPAREKKQKKEMCSWWCSLFLLQPLSIQAHDARALTTTTTTTTTTYERAHTHTLIRDVGKKKDRNHLQSTALPTELSHGKHILEREYVSKVTGKGTSRATKDRTRDKWRFIQDNECP